jgi:hypothetical protein
MQRGLVDLHNLLRWVILVLLIVSIVRSYAGWKQRKVFTERDRKIWLFTLISCHLTLLTGLIQLLFGRYGIFSGLPPGVSLMKDKFYRFYWIEHPFAMIIAIALVTAMYRLAKKQIGDMVKFRRAFWFFLVALLLILAAVPWPFREIVGRPLIPGMQ